MKVSLNQIHADVLSAILPSIISEHFVLVRVDNQSKDLTFYLDEKDEVLDPEEGHIYALNGFLPESKIQDFPIRDKKTILVIRRRRWTDMTTGANYSNKYRINAEGSRYSQEFADFLKCGFVIEGNIITFP